MALLYLQGGVGALGSSRTTRARPLSASEVKESAVPQAVFHLLVGSATVTFPGSSRSGPGREVWIEHRAACVADPAFPSPVILNAKQYNDAIIPVLCDPALQPDVAVNQLALIQGPNRLAYVERVADALCRSFEAAGY